MKIRLNTLSVLAPSALSSLGVRLVCALTWGSAALWAGYRLSWAVAPAPLSLPYWNNPDVEAAARDVAARHWFGVAMPPAPPAVRVLGVFAPQNPDAPSGFAVVEQNGQSRAWLQGQGDAEGWRLDRILPGGMWLKNGSQQQFYPLVHESDANAATPMDSMPSPEENDDE